MFARDAVLFANEAFYQAFANADVAAMDAVWARNVPVTCIHPGWHVLNDREHVMEVWRRIFASEEQPPLICRSPEAFVAGDSAFVICYEQLPDAVMVATNIFVRHRQQWRMVHHQSSPTPNYPAHLTEPEMPAVLAH
jgi:SnoaL-like domain